MSNRQDDYNEAFNAGKRAAAAELQPLVDAISDAIIMFNEVETASGLTPKERGRFLERYPAMAKQLERLLALANLTRSPS